MRGGTISASASAAGGSSSQGRAIRIVARTASKTFMSSTTGDSVLVL
jgi:hypothetical protein